MMDFLSSALSRPRHIEAARTTDMERLAALHEASFPHGWSAHDLAALADDDAVDALVAVPYGFFGRGQVEGFILMRSAADEAEVLTIAVDPRHRRHGLGQRLLSAGILAVRQRGAAALFLEVAADNPAALSLYRRNGFQQVGIRKAYLPRGDGTSASALVMRRDDR
ncbi:MAG: GNAT family N-acetyltransferase [Hyphomicrobiaceae bacterium]|nr:GNAT family N-acetyltransferase [Hyphomicrobiaceae bacterium]